MLRHTETLPQTQCQLHLNSAEANLSQWQSKPYPQGICGLIKETDVAQSMDFEDEFEGPKAEVGIFNRKIISKYFLMFNFFFLLVILAVLVKCNFPIHTQDIN